MKSCFIFSNKANSFSLCAELLDFIFLDLDGVHGVQSLVSRFSLVLGLDCFRLMGH